MADNVTTQTATLSTVPGSTGIATDQVTYSGDANQHIAPTSLVVISGSEGSKTATAVPAGGGVEAAALRVTLASDSTGLISVDDNGGSLTIDGTVGISGTVTVDSELPAAASLADNTANPTVPAVGAFGLVWDGATWDRQPGTSADGTLVNLGANNDVTVTSGSITADTELPTAAALADNAANPTAPAVGAFGMLWDGATWDRRPGNSTDGTLVNLGTNNDVTVTSGSITADTELPTAAALADNAANPTAPAVGAFNMVWDGATWDRAAGTSADGALVNLGANNDVTVTGTAAVAEVRPATGTLANVAASASSVTLLASNANRKQATVYNDSTVALYLKFGATASTSSFTVKIFGNGYYELPFPVYSGVLDGIWDSASGNARVTELT